MDVPPGAHDKMAVKFYDKREYEKCDICISKENGRLEFTCDEEYNRLIEKLGIKKGLRFIDTREGDDYPFGFCLSEIFKICELRKLRRELEAEEARYTKEYLKK